MAEKITFDSSESLPQYCCFISVLCLYLLLFHVHYMQLMMYLSTATWKKMTNNPNLCNNKKNIISKTNSNWLAYSLFMLSDDL